MLRPKRIFRRFARAVIDRGVDVYHGRSAHVFQGVEVYRSKPILYDTGDFIDDYAIHPELRNDWSFLFRVSVEGDNFVRLELTPVELRYARAHGGGARNARPKSGADGIRRGDDGHQLPGFALPLDRSPGL
jgi:poly-gamma-glutamate capsule biosynthesis protein CapA/YwtB (metallophosphatase superfamily)